MDPKKVEHYLRLMLTEGLGFDLSDPNLTDTPARMTRMYCNEFFCSCGCEFDGWTVFPNQHKYDEIINPGTIDFVSVCSHHFLPFAGKAWLLYVPDNYLIGASKASRLVNFHSCKPQVQENLSEEILHDFNRNVRPKGCMIVMRATHGCMSCRGIRQADSNMVTSAVSGCFKEDRVMEEKGYRIIELAERK